MEQDVVDGDALELGVLGVGLGGVGVGAKPPSLQVPPGMPRTSAASARDGVTQRFVTARDRELKEAREASDLAAMLSTLRAQRKTMNEEIERRIQARRRPKSANLVARLDYRTSVKEALLRPVTAGATVGGVAADASSPKPKTGSSSSSSSSSGGLPPTLVTSAVAHSMTGVTLTVGGKAIALDFHARADAGPRSDADDDDDDIIDAALDPTEIVSRAASRAGSRPGSGIGIGRPMSPRGGAQLPSLRPGSGQGSRPVSATGRPRSRGPPPPTGPIQEPAHVVQVSSRLTTPIILTRAPAKTTGVAKSSRAKDRPSMAGWWETAGRGEALERQDAQAKAEAEAEAAAAAAASGGDPTSAVTPPIPLGPAGVPLVAESSIGPAPDVLSSIIALRAKIEAEDAYDVDRAAEALERIGVSGLPGLPAERLARALATVPASTSAAARAQAERPVTASSGFFGLGENPVAREKRLTALKNQLLAAAKKGGAGKGGGKKK